MINIEKGVKLYLILAPYLPEGEEKLSSFDYIKQIIYNIEKRNPRDYVDAIQIMQDITLDEMKKKSADEILNLFIEGLAENKFISLCKFLRSFGYGR